MSVEKRSKGGKGQRQVGDQKFSQDFKKHSLEEKEELRIILEAS